jgi:hypothetical protein
MDLEIFTRVMSMLGKMRILILFDGAKAIATE